MSLAEQSQQWYPTSVQVTVHQARNLRIKGKNGTNDAYAIIQVAKDKFSTSVAEKCVAPVWKEEASFDLPLFHPGNAERCTLYIIVMHRAQVGLDKFLGQAVINLLDLHDNSTRKKTEWFKLVDKSGKEDKARGEVLLDIQFMRSNMSASMLDLSLQDKPRSRISKLKDKVRGNKKSGFSDSVSAIVPSSNQVLTDSEGEADAQSLNQSPEGKKKSKLKTLFAPKSNLQRNISQSMSTLGTFPEKNSSLSGSRSSGLNVDSPDVKKKFKFLAHKRTGSSDSKVSQGPFSLLGRSKQSNNDLNNLCINGSHVYAEEAESKSGSTLSLNSSGQGSVVDLHKHSSDASADYSKSIPVPSVKFETEDRAMLEQQRHQEEEERKQAEERRIAEAKRLEDEGKRKAEAKRVLEEKERRYQEEQERKRHFLEDEARRKKQREEEEERIKQEEERRMLEAAETQRLQEERGRVEEQKKQEEASMNERLTSLFGMIRKKEERKEEVPLPKEELPTPAPPSDLRDPLQPNSHHSTNPFEEIPLSSDLPANSNDSPADQQKLSHNTQTSSAMVFLNRTAKVSAVKPRLTQSLDSESADCQTPSQLCHSPANSPLSSIPTESPDTFSELHSSLAPPHKSESLFGSPCGSIENLSTVGSSPTMADNRRATLLPFYTGHEIQSGENVHVKDFKNPAYVETEIKLQEIKKISLPLPDYETLFPKKRHGVQGHTQWDHLIAEVNQKHRDIPSQFLEMSVDGPEEEELNPRSSTSQDSPAMKHYQIHQQVTKPISTKAVAAPAPPKPVTSSHPQSAADSNQKQKQSQTVAHHSLLSPNPSAVLGPGTTETSGRGDLSGTSRNGARKVFSSSPAATHALRPTSQIETSLPDGQIKAQVAMTKEAPTAKPRQKVSGKEPTQQEEPAVTSNKSTNSNIQTLSSSNVSSRNKKSEQAADFADFNPFPSSELLSKDPWAPPVQNREVDDIFISKRKEQKPEDQGMSDDFDKIISQQKPTDPFSGFNGSDSKKDSKNRKKDDDSKQASPVFQRRNSQRTRKILSATTLSNNKGSKPQEPVSEKGLTVTTASQDLHPTQVVNESVTLQPQADMTAQSNFYEEDVFGAVPFTVASGLSSSEPLQVVMEEPVSQAGGLSGGKTLLRAWVSPSEISPVSAQNSNGGGLALTPRRPHPVKPLSSVESQHPTIAPPVKEIKVQDITLQKIKVTESMESGPYTQLTQEELITLVVRQQTDLSKKDAKIVELEEYIDNLLVRVIDEKPSILQALNAAKPV